MSRELAFERNRGVDFDDHRAMARDVFRGGNSLTRYPVAAELAIAMEVQVDGADAGIAMADDLAERAHSLGIAQVVGFLAAHRAGLLADAGRVAEPRTPGAPPAFLPPIRTACGSTCAAGATWRPWRARGSGCSPPRDGHGRPRAWRPDWPRPRPGSVCDGRSSGPSSAFSTPIPPAPWQPRSGGSSPWPAPRPPPRSGLTGARWPSCACSARGRTRRSPAPSDYPRTGVRYHVRKIFRKLDVGRRQDAVRRAVALGILPDDIPTA